MKKEKQTTKRKKQNKQISNKINSTKRREKKYHSLICFSQIRQNKTFISNIFIQTTKRICFFKKQQKNKTQTRRQQIQINNIEKSSKKNNNKKR